MSTINNSIPTWISPVQLGTSSSMYEHYIDLQGNLVKAIQHSPKLSEWFHEGLAPFSENGKYGYLDMFGQVAIPPQFTEAQDFVNGLAIVGFPNGEGAFIDHSGQARIHLDSTDDIWPFVDDLTFYPQNPNLIGDIVLLDKQGNRTPLLIEDIDDINAISERLISVHFIDNDWGFVNLKGEPVAGGYCDVKPFSEGLAAAETEDGWGFINRSGDFEIEPTYDSCGRFSESIAAVCKDGKYGYIDRMGRQLTPFIYEEAKPFSQGLASVNRNGRWGYINRQGEEVIPFQFAWAGCFERQDGSPNKIQFFWDD